MLVVDVERGVVIGEPDRRIRRHYEDRRNRQARYFAGLGRLKASAR